MNLQAKSYPLPLDLAEELESVAERRRLPIDELLEAAVRRFLEEEAAVLAKVKAARANADAGATVSWDDAERGFRETIARVAGRRTAP